MLDVRGMKDLFVVCYEFALEKNNGIYAILFNNNSSSSNNNSNRNNNTLQTNQDQQFSLLI
jgi:hypothetical protein